MKLHAFFRTAASLLAGITIAVLVATSAALLIFRLFGHQMFAITSGSMSGTIDRGALVVAAQVPTEELRVGDILTYVPPSTTGITTPVTHRIVSIDEAADGSLAFRTRGDANADVDFWTFGLGEDDLQSVARFSIPQLGQPVLFLSDPVRRQITIGIPALVIALYAARDVFRAARREPAPEPAPTI